MIKRFGFPFVHIAKQMFLQVGLELRTPAFRNYWMGPHTYHLLSLNNQCFEFVNWTTWKSNFRKKCKLVMFNGIPCLPCSSPHVLSRWSTLDRICQDVANLISSEKRTALCLYLSWHPYNIRIVECEMWNWILGCGGIGICSWYYICLEGEPINKIQTWQQQTWTDMLKLKPKRYYLGRSKHKSTLSGNLQWREKVSYNLLSFIFT